MGKKKRESSAGRREEERMRVKEELLAKASAAIRRHHVGEKQNLQAFIRNKRKMFEIKYKIGVKLDAIQKLMDEEHRRMAAVNKQKDLLGAEEDKFQEYKDEINEKLQEAAARAEAEEEAKKTQKAIKDELTEEISRLSRKIDERDRTVQTYRKYKAFLDAINKNVLDKEAAQAQILGQDSEERPHEEESGLGGLESSESLLEIFKSLEDSNLFLIQNVQELQEQMAAMDEQTKGVVEESKAEISRLEEHEASLAAALEEERRRVASSEQHESYFELLNAKGGGGKETSPRSRAKSRVKGRKGGARRPRGGEGRWGSGSGSGVKDVDVLEGLPTEEKIAVIQNKVTDVYKKTKIGTSEILDVIPMLTNIERRLQELFYHVGLLDNSEVMAEEKARAKREKEMNRIRTKQEQASVLALRKMDQDRRARLPKKRKIGKPLMRRSDPHTKKVSRVDSDAEKQADAKMYQYFFQQ